MAISLTLSQIIALSGGNARRMKHLANEGVFLPLEEERASRAARNYSISEACLACIAARLDQFNIPSPTLVDMCASIRQIYRVPLDHGFNHFDQAHRLWAREVLLKINAESNLTAEDKAKQASSLGLADYPTGKPADITTEEMHRLRNWVLLEKAREGVTTQLALTIGEDGSWTYWLDGQPPEDQQVDAFIVINLHRVLSVLR